MTIVSIGFDPEQIAALRRQHRIARWSLFGSILRDDFGPESDVDVLVEFEERQTPGLACFTMQEGLSGILGRRVDLNTPKCLSKYFLDQVEAEARPICVQAS
jgi:predicted nucleotidyltransferase